MSEISVEIRICQGGESRVVELHFLPTVFGRGKDCDFDLHDESVSRRHFLLREDNGLLFVQDLDSANGTSLGGNPVREDTVFPGDSLQAGSTTIEIIRIQVSASKELSWVGQEFAGLKVMRLLGSGGGGRVYLAHQMTLHRDIALKAMHPELAKDRTAVATFLKEARSVAALSHPRIVQVFDVGRHQGIPFFFMEYMEGGSLESRLGEDGILDWRSAAQAAQDCISALEFAWGKDLLHHDVKPANLLVGSEGETKLADLGIAGSRHNLKKVPFAGSPHYMAPERILKRDVDFRSDFYSLGCTLFRLLTGHHVFPQKKAQEILRAQCREDPPTLQDYHVEVPELLSKLIDRLLRKDPQERPHSHEQVRRELEFVLRASGSTSGMGKGRTRGAMRRRGGRPSSRSPWAGVLFLLFLFLVLALFFLPESLKGWREFLSR